MGRQGAAPSVKDVAAAAGVSTGTVSNVLNRPARVGARTRERVEAVMAELGFVVNEGARQLRAGRSRSVGYVMLDARNPYFTDLAAAMESQVDAADLSLLLCNSMNSPRREADYLNRLLQQRVHGIMVTPIDTEHPLLAEVPRRGTPVVLVDRAPRRDTHCSVSVDNVHGGELAAQHLIDLGHRRLAFIGGPRSLGQVEHRICGARRAVEHSGLSGDALTVIADAGQTIEGGRSALEQLIAVDRHLRPTAAVCGNDLVALGVLQQCARRSIDVPGDLAIVGYDDIAVAAAAVVPLTSVRQPRQQVGERAAELVMNESGDVSHRHVRTELLPRLVVRGSTDPTFGS